VIIVGVVPGTTGVAVALPPPPVPPIGVLVGAGVAVGTGVDVGTAVGAVVGLVDGVGVVVAEGVPTVVAVAKGVGIGVEVTAGCGATLVLLVQTSTLERLVTVCGNEVEALRPAKGASPALVTVTWKERGRYGIEIE